MQHFEKYEAEQSNIRGGMVHVLVPNRHGTVRAPRFGAWGLTVNTGNSPPIQKGAPRSNATLFDNRQQKNSECCELRA